MALSGIPQSAVSMGKGAATPPHTRPQPPVYAREGVGHLWLINPVARNQDALALHKGV